MLRWGLAKGLDKISWLNSYHKTEKEVLDAIKTLAVQKENTMVARVALNEMIQDRDEPNRSFGARIRDQAGVCKYLFQCTCRRDINYSTHTANQDMSLKGFFHFVERKEDGRRSANRLLESQSTENISQYRKNQRNHHKDLADNKSEPWNFCGKRDHGRNASSHIPKTNDPAYNTTCDYCDKKTPPCISMLKKDQGAQAAQATPMWWKQALLTAFAHLIRSRTIYTLVPLHLTTTSSRTWGSSGWGKPSLRSPGSICGTQGLPDT